jgi:hypothetical protein
LPAIFQRNIMLYPPPSHPITVAKSACSIRALKFRADPHTRDPRCPKKTTFTRLLHEVDDDRLERALLRWQDQILGPRQDRIIIFDGKKVRHGGVEIVNAVDSQGRFLGSVVTQSKSNEIPAGRQLLEGQDLLGKINVRIRGSQNRTR